MWEIRITSRGEFLPLVQKKMTSEDISIGTLYLVVEI